MKGFDGIRTWKGIAAVLVLLAASTGMAGAAPRDPAAEGQLLIYTLNRARSNPQAYQLENDLAVDLSDVAPQPPLAVNNSLVGSAGFHAEEMATFDYFGHQSQVTGDWPNKMARDNGYALPDFYDNDANYIESISAGYPNVLVALQSLIEDAGHDPPGHRIHLLAMDPFFQQHREIGVGAAFNPDSQFGRYYVIHTAVVSAGDTFLTGVVYADANGNQRYDLNEGLGSVTISAGPFTTTTNSAGGWSLQVPAGDYAVTAEGGAFGGSATANVTITNANVEVDFISDHAAGIVNFQEQEQPPMPAPPVLSAPAVSPDLLPSDGGTVSLSVNATTDGAIAEVSARITGPVVDETVPLALQDGTTYTGSFAVPANETDTDATFSVIFSATDTNGQAAAPTVPLTFTVQARQADLTAPVLSAPGVSPAVLKASGGSAALTVVATDDVAVREVRARLVGRNFDQTYVLTRKNGDTFRRVLKFRSNTTRADRVYTLTFTATDTSDNTSDPTDPITITIPAGRR